MGELDREKEGAPKDGLAPGQGCKYGRELVRWLTRDG